VLNMKLRHLPQWIEHRRKIARLYHEALEGIPFVVRPPYDGNGHFDVFQNYVITTPERDRLREHLRRDGIETLVSWPKPLWRHQALCLDNLHLPETEHICQEALSLPMSAETTPDQVGIVVESIRDFLAPQPAGSLTFAKVV